MFIGCGVLLIVLLFSFSLSHVFVIIGLIVILWVVVYCLFVYWFCWCCWIVAFVVACCFDRAWYFVV